MSPRSLHRHAPSQQHYAWDRDLPPIIEVNDGDIIELSALDASGGQLNTRSTADDVHALDLARVNPVTGPIAVQGARPGDCLEVEVLHFSPSNWGWTAIIPGFGLLADDFPTPWLTISEVDAGRGEVRFLDDFRLPLRPFPGTIGVAPPQHGQHSLIPPTTWGGNLDIRHLTEGCRLLLPIGVESALLSIGDTHAAMGDGEVCGTAVESPMELAVRVSIRKDLNLASPQFTQAASADPIFEDGFHACTGVGPDLMEACRSATRAAIEYISRMGRCSPEEAYALASVACDLRIHEIVDAPNWVVGCLVPRRLFAPRQR